MSLAWSFFSYSPTRYAEFFGGDAPDAEDVVVQAVTWDENAWDDPMLPAHLARRIARQGIDYDGLTPVEASLLDDLVPILFSPEGMADDLQVEPAGIGELPLAAVRALLDRADDESALEQANALLKGRRAGAAKPDARCLYVLYGPEEVAVLRREITALLDGDGSWEDPDDEAAFREELLPLLQDLEEEGDALAGFLR